MTPAPVTEADHDGGCLCGEIRYHIQGPIQTVTHCHCTMCRKSTGAPVSTWVTVPREGFTLAHGELTAFKSSDHGVRSFCPSCGAQVTFWTSHYPDWIDVTLGTLDGADDFAAQKHIWLVDRLPWLRLDERLPGFQQDSGSGEASG